MPIIKVGQRNPLEDGRQSDRALAIQRGMTRHLENLGMAVLAEFSLANGRRADLIGLDRRGLFTIIEIKSSIEDYRADSKWPEYADFCDRFYFATHGEVPAEIFPEGQGLFIADEYGAHPLRESVELKLATATRKALTLRFARQAALRAGRISDYAQQHLGDLPTFDESE